MKVYVGSSDAVLMTHQAPTKYATTKACDNANWGLVGHWIHKIYSSAILQYFTKTASYDSDR